MRLTVTDDDGDTDTDSTFVTVNAPPNVAPSADAGGPYTVQVGSALSFDGTGSSDSDGTIASYAWDFGDGTFGTGAQPSHTYAAPGTYLARLTVTDNRGATDEDTSLVTVTSRGNQPPIADAGRDRAAVAGANVVFDASGSSDADGTIASYAWEFGDGTDATGAQAQHAYTAAGNYLVKLTVTDDDGAVDDDFALVAVSPAQTGGNVAPVAAAGADVAAHAGAPVAFNGSGSSDGDGTIIAYQWDFGDGGTAAGLSATHAYANGGVYTVTLTVIDDDGARGTDTLIATINALPVADPGSARTAKAGETLTFDASGSSDADGTIATFAWDFGDGARGEGESATHAYAAEGAFTVKLTVTDDKGARGSATVTVLVTAAPPVPSGCGCDASGGGSAAGLPMLLLGLALAQRRRFRLMTSRSG